MKAEEAAYIRIKEKELKAECVRLSLAIEQSGGGIDKTSTAKVIAGAEKIAKWVEGQR